MPSSPQAGGRQELQMVLMLRVGRNSSWVQGRGSFIVKGAVSGWVLTGEAIGEAFQKVME